MYWQVGVLLGRPGLCGEANVLQHVGPAARGAALSLARLEVSVGCAQGPRVFPGALSPISMLYYDNNDNVMLRYYQDM